MGRGQRANQKFSARSPHRHRCDAGWLRPSLWSQQESGWAGQGAATETCGCFRERNEKGAHVKRRVAADSMAAACLGRGGLGCWRLEFSVLIELYPRGYLSGVEKEGRWNKRGEGVVSQCAEASQLASKGRVVGVARPQNRWKPAPVRARWVRRGRRVESSLQAHSADGGRGPGLRGSRRRV